MLIGTSQTAASNSFFAAQMWRQKTVFEQSVVKREIALLRSKYTITWTFFYYLFKSIVNKPIQNAEEHTNSGSKK